MERDMIRGMRARAGRGGGEASTHLTARSWHFSAGLHLAGLLASTLPHLYRIPTYQTLTTASPYLPTALLAARDEAALPFCMAAYAYRHALLRRTDFCAPRAGRSYHGCAAKTHYLPYNV